MEQKNTLVIGASQNPERYSYKAIHLLKVHQHPVFAIGLKSGLVAGVPIEQEFNPDSHPPIDTVTLYVSAKNQLPYFDLLAKINPARVIFNPGTENQNLSQFLDEHQIAWEEACTLVLLHTAQY